MNRSEILREHQKKDHFKDILKKLSMDKNYIRAEGNYLYYKEQGEIVKVLDLSGGYGSLMIGHNNNEICNHASKLLKNKIPIHAQISDKPLVQQLEDKLNYLIAMNSDERYILSVYNTGSETVEAAINHALISYMAQLNNLDDKVNTEILHVRRLIAKNQDRKFIINDKNFIIPDDLFDFIRKENEKTLKKNRIGFLASNNSFHGKTLGALSLTHNVGIMKDLSALIEGMNNEFFTWDTQVVDRIINNRTFNILYPKYENNTIFIEKIKFHSIAGMIIESIQGEGGINEMPVSFLKHISKLSRKMNIPLIDDEIQSGMFRTGDFLAIQKK